MTTPLRFRLRTRWQIGLRYCGLATNVRAVAWALSTWMGPDGDRCRPAVSEIAEAVGLERRAVFTALKTLERRGFLRRSGGGGRGRASTYEPVIPAEIEVWIEAVLGRSNGARTDTVSAEKGCTRTTQTVHLDVGNGARGDTPAYRAFQAGIEEVEDREPLPADVDAVARSGRPAEALRMLTRRRQTAEEAR